MSRTTTALVVPELNGKFELREVHLDAIQPDEVLVEIHASGLCHTDLSCATGVLPCAPNAVLGHEGASVPTPSSYTPVYPDQGNQPLFLILPGAGIVLSTGSAVTHVAPGDKVLLSFSHCQTCPPCLSGHPAYCHAFNDRNFGGRRPDGSSPFSSSSSNGKETMFAPFFGQSSFARHTLVHRSCAVRVPPETSLDQLALYAPLGCGMQTGAGAVLNALRVTRGSSVAVFGVGSVGMAAVMAAARIAGAGVVVAVDLQDQRLELAKRLGATHGVRVGKGEGSVVEEIRRICPPNGVDFAVDCTGVPAVIRDTIDCLGTKGRAATVGAPGFGKCVSVDVMEHLTYGKEYVGCCEGDSLPAEVSSQFKRA